MLEISQSEWGEGVALGLRTSDNSMSVPSFQVGKLQFIEGLPMVLLFTNGFMASWGWVW